MLQAIIAAIVTAIVIIATLVAVLVIRERNAVLTTRRQKDINQFETVGIGTSPMETTSHAKSAKNGEVMVATNHDATAKPADHLSSRFAAMGVLAAAIFGSLTAKLWSMQVMASSSYASQAEENLYTTVTTPAARGTISDVNGTALVKNRISQTVLADGVVAEDRDLLRRLSAVLGLPVNVIRKRINAASEGAQNRRVIEEDARMRDIAFISEHADAFKGVSIESRTVREYPYGALASHVLGYTGAPDEDTLQSTVEGRIIESNDVIGKSGIEASYDNLLAGDRGQRRLMVDATGNVLNVVSEVQSVKGSDIRLTIDARVQYVADSQLMNTIAPNGTIGAGRGVAGAIVAMDVRDGSILAMSSFPNFDPTYFTGTIPTDVWELYRSEEAYAPLNNRAMNGQYAAASTYKAFTSLAGLECGFVTPENTWTCSGSWDGFHSGDVQMCWNHKGHGTLDLRGGIVNSCDVVFYEIAMQFFLRGPEGTGELSATALQDQLAKFRFDKTTGIDLPGESSGRIPTPEWKAEHWRNVPSEAQWRGGDYTNMIIGQGDVLVTPLQIAVAYGGIATGRLMKPHLLKGVYNVDGDPVINVQPEVVSEPDIKPEYLDYVRDALRGMVLSNTKISEGFSAAGVEAAGKSGTAENSGKYDNAWFVAYAPYNDPKYVVACVLEQGGSGSDYAAPIVVEVLNEVMRVDAGTSTVQVGHLNGSSGHSVALVYPDAGSRTD